MSSEVFAGQARPLPSRVADSNQKSQPRLATRLWRARASSIPGSVSTRTGPPIKPRPLWGQRPETASSSTPKNHASS